jgi:hypothetical protein
LIGTCALVSSILAKSFIAMTSHFSLACVAVEEFHGTTTLPLEYASLNRLVYEDINPDGLSQGA